MTAQCLKDLDRNGTRTVVAGELKAWVEKKRSLARPAPIPFTPTTKLVHAMFIHDARKDGICVCNANA